MPVIRIKDLAEVMIRELAPIYGYDPKKITITEIGAKPGEKLYEELMSQEETRRAVELPRYFSVLPAFRGIYKDISYDYKEIVSSEVKNAYVSADEPALSQEELRSFLRKNKLLSTEAMSAKQPDVSYWPGDKGEG
jgi:FlaA1/EpsC-like NDP-sugar epimerase